MKSKSESEKVKVTAKKGKMKLKSGGFEWRSCLAGSLSEIDASKDDYKIEMWDWKWKQRKVRVWTNVGFEGSPIKWKVRVKLNMKVITKKEKMKVETKKWGFRGRAAR